MLITIYCLVANVDTSFCRDDQTTDWLGTCKARLVKTDGIKPSQAGGVEQGRLLLRQETSRDSGDVGTLSQRRLGVLAPWAHLFVCAIGFALTVARRDNDASVGADEADR